MKSQVTCCRRVAVTLLVGAMAVPAAGQCNQLQQFPTQTSSGLQADGTKALMYESELFMISDSFNVVLRLEHILF